MVPAAKILIVDDEANIRGSLQEILTRDGHEVLAVESGEAALKSIKTDKFDLALIDLKLTGIGGIEVLEALRQQSPDTIAIVLTAHASLKTAIRALRQGAHDYLFKPCRPAELRESIRKGLQRHQQKQPLDLLQQLEEMSSNLDAIRAAVVGRIDESPPTVSVPMDTRGRFLEQGGFVVDSLRHMIVLDGHPLDLTPTEFDLLAYLITVFPQVVSPQELVFEVQGYESERWEASEAVRQHIHRIRQEIKNATGRTGVVRTVRGVGYTIAEPPELST